MGDITSPLSPPLDEYQRQYEVLKDDVRQLVADLDRDQFNWKPAPERWSIAQCLVHLNKVDWAYVRALDHGIEKARERGLVGGRRIRYNSLERWFIRSLEPPPRRRFRAPKTVVPTEDHPREEVLERYLSTKDSLLGLLRRADGLDICRAKINSPLLKILRLRIGAAFALIAAHDRRHLWQANQVRRHPEFPNPARG
jgi:DinB superfamily